MKSIVFLLSLLITSSLQVYAQKTATGNVTGTGGLPLEAATITGKKSGISTVTNDQGHFSFSVPDNETLLLVTATGYKLKEVAVGNNLSVVLEENHQQLDEVVVVGYGTQKKSDITGSLVSITPKSFNKGVLTSVDNLIAGRAAGVQVTQASSEPGGGVSIRIRGANSINASNEPLYVIDGFPIDNAPVTPASTVASEPVRRNPLNALNPADIASIEILKDASATAIYGSRGANGVILITTKRGAKGPIAVNYLVEGGVQQVAKRVPVLSAGQYVNLLNDLRAGAGAAPEFTQAEIDAIGKGVNWQDEIFRTGYSQNHQLNFSGGQDKFSYYASLNYFDQNGVILSSGIKRYTGRVNLSYTGDKFKFGINLNSSKINDRYVPNGVSINEGAGIVNSAIYQDPTLPIYQADGKTYAQSDVVNLENPLGLAHAVFDKAETNRTFGNVFAEYFILPSLSVKLNAGADEQSSRRDAYITSNTRRGLASNGIANVRSIQASNSLLELTARYNKQFGDHGLELLGGYTYQVFKNNSLQAGAQDFSTDAFFTDNLAAGSRNTYTLGTGRAQNQLRSYLGRINYNLLGKYLLTANFRADGSSRFGESSKYGYFPSVALGWQIGEEDFVKDIRQISNLKLRASYGTTGNQDIGNYRSLVLLGTVGQAVFNETPAIGISTTQLANPNLKWETTKQFNIGVDFGLFENRLTGTVDYFTKQTTDLLLELPVSWTTGFSTTLANVGGMSNRGWDFQLNSVNLDGKLSWQTSLNVSTVKNKVTDIGGLPRIYQGSAGFFNSFSIIEVGQPLNAYYGYQVAGILQQGESYAPQPLSAPGELKFVDVNGDKAISTADRTILGSPYPDFTYGLNNSFSYGNFSFSFFLQGVQGGKILNINISESENPISFRRNRLERSYTDRWTVDNPSTENPSGLAPVFAYVDASGTINSRAVEDASFLRLKNLTFSYDIPLRSKNIFKSAQVYAVAQNLVTFSKYLGFDPEVSSFGTSNVRVDYNAYPLARIYTVGLNFKF